MSSHQAATLLATGTTGAAGRLLSALKANMGLSQTNEGLFAGLLAQTEATVKAPEPKAEAPLPAPASHEAAARTDSAREAEPRIAARSDEAPRRSESRKEQARKAEREDRAERADNDAAAASESTAEEAQTQEAAQTQEEAVSAQQTEAEAKAARTEEETGPDEKRLMELLAALCPLEGEASVEKSDKTGQLPQTAEKAQTDALATETPVIDPATLAPMQQAKDKTEAEGADKNKTREIIADALLAKAGHRNTQTATAVPAESSVGDAPLSDEAARAAVLAGQAQTEPTKQAKAISAQNAQNQSPATTASTQPVLDAQSAIPAQGLLQQSAAPQKAAAGSAVQDIAKIGASTSAPTNTTPQPTGEGVRSAGFDFASQLSALRAAKTTPTSTPQAIEQVAVQLNKMAKDGQDELTIHLKPAELGKIEIKLEIRADKTVTGTIIAENQSTLNLLSKDAGSLQRALLEAGLQADMGSLSFSLKGDGQNAFAQQNGSGRGMNFAMPSDGADDASLLAATTANDDTVLLPGRVNLRV